MHVQDADTRTLYNSLKKSTVCPACGGAKKLSQTVCLADYRKLPAAMRKALYASLFDGYHEAVIEAFSFLGLTEFQTVAAGEDTV